jgi:hypothetical protein
VVVAVVVDVVVCTRRVMRATSLASLSTISRPSAAELRATTTVKLSEVAPAPAMVMMASSMPSTVDRTDDTMRPTASSVTPSATRSSKDSVSSTNDTSVKPCLVAVVTVVVEVVDVMVVLVTCGASLHFIGHSTNDNSQYSQRLHISWSQNSSLAVTEPVAVAHVATAR